MTRSALRAAPALEEATRQRLYRRTLVSVVLAQVFGGAGLSAGVTVGALLAQSMLGGAGVAGLPNALFTLGSAASALLVGRLSQRLGRRTGLAAGFGGGVAGAIGVVVAAATDDVVLLFAALLVYGAGSATNLQARYAGTDLAHPHQRGTAVSIAMVATTAGAVLGPSLITWTGGLAAGLHLPVLAGPFLLAAAAYLVAGTVLFVLLRPDPLLVARGLPAEVRVTSPRASAARAQRGVLTGAAVMVLTQVAMVAIMTMTPVQMRDHGESLADVGVVVGVHIAAMYLPSLVTGVLVDRVGRLPVAAASACVLLAAGIVAAVAPAGSMPMMLVALALLGLGWNLGLISGTALVVDAAPAETRARTQGTVDVLVALAGAGGAALSGMVVAGAGFSGLALGCGLLSVLLLPLLLVTGGRAPAARA